MTSRPGVMPSLLLSGLLGLAAADAKAQTADAETLADLQRAVAALRAENRALSERLRVLEAQPPAQHATTTAAAAAATIDASAAPAPTDSQRSSATTTADRLDAQRLARRVLELESAQVAQQDAVRRIIRESVSTLGSKINEAASLGGTLAVSVGQRQDFSGQRQRIFGLSTADLELEIQANDWAIGRIKFEYIDSARSGVSSGSAANSGNDRLTVDTAYLTLGDARRFPPVLSVGRMVLPFGISTGHPVADVLSLGTPLTVEAFEMRQNAMALGLHWPTPQPGPPGPPVVAPPARGQLIRPWLVAASQRLGYAAPATAPARLPAMLLNPEPPPWHAGVYVFDGLTGSLASNFGAVAGYRGKGHCGQRFEDLPRHGLCPWAVNVDVAYNSSIFNSRFLQAEYADVLGRIGRVAGLSASVKANLGPMALVGEWNGALRSASLTDDLGRAIHLRPSAWQLSLGYQLDWNPWLQEIGAQGSYLALGLSRSQGLAGTSGLAAGLAGRMGALPRQRLFLTAGEWVQEGLRLALEFGREWDYPVTDGGTGRAVNSWVTSLTYAW